MSTTWLIDKNLAQSTLAAGYTAGNSTITVQTGDGAKFDSPTGSQAIMLALNDPPDYFLICTGRSGDVLTVQTTGAEGTTAISEAANCKVTQVITAGVFQALLTAAGIKSQYGAFASLPSSGMNSGDQYFSSDGPYDFVYDGTLWRARAFGYPCVVPAPVGSPWVQTNFGGSSVAGVAGVLSIVWDGTGGDLFRGYMQLKPGTNYTVTAGMKSTNKGVMGVGIYDSVSGRSQTLMWGGDNYIHVFKFASGFGSLTSVYQSSFNWSSGPEVLWLRINEGATYRTYYASLDGVNWIQIYQEAAATNFVPTHVGIGQDTTGATPLGVSVFSYNQTSP